jgi:peptidoglycan hydrolase CwlO-like protein
MKSQSNPGLIAARKFVTALIALVILALVIWSARIAFVREISRAKFEQKCDDCLETADRFQEKISRLRIQIEQQKRVNEEMAKELEKQWKKINNFKIPVKPDA